MARLDLVKVEVKVDFSNLTEKVKVLAEAFDRIQDLIRTIGVEFDMLATELEKED